MSTSELVVYRFPFARYPAVRVVLCFIIGIILGYLGWLEIGLYPFLVILAGYLTIEIWNKLHVSTMLSYMVRFSYIVVLVVFGMLSWEVRNTGPPEELEIWHGLQNEQIEIKGAILKARVNDTRTLTAFMQVDSVRLGDVFLAFPIKLQLRAFRVSDTHAEMVRLNHYVSVKIQARSMPIKRNPNAFDVEAWLLREGVSGTGIIEDVYESAYIESRWSWLWLQSEMHQLLERSVGDDTRPLFKAILLGEKSELDFETRTAFSRAGLSHLMAVSGMHVGFVLMPVWMLIPWFWTRKSGRSAGLMTIALILFFYAGLTGFTASVSRASITACLLAIGKLFQRNRDSLNTTGVAGMILLLNNPGSLFDVGFQLSFCAVTVILVLGPVMRDWIPSKIRFSWKGTVLQFLGISIIVQMGLFPILADSFGEFSIAGPIANTAGVPITQMLFLWSMIALPLAAMSDLFLNWVMLPAEYLALALLWIVQIVGTKEMAWISIPSVSKLLPILWFLGIGLFASSSIPQIRYKWGIVFLAFLCAGRVHEIYKTAQISPLQVTVFDVGQGDGILIQTPNGKTILYDTGVLNPFQNSGRTILTPELKARGITKVDAVILSHPHADHIGGMIAILESFEVGVIYQPEFVYGSAVFAGYMELARKKEVSIVEVKAGMEIELDPNVKMFVLHPSNKPMGHDPNAHSVSIKLVYGETSFLLTGDAELLAETEMLANYGHFLKSDWYKAGHHGSKTSSNRAFLEVVQPNYIAVSLALSNRYRHPHREATERLVGTGADVKYTSLSQALVYESDGKRINRVAW